MPDDLPTSDNARAELRRTMVELRRRFDDAATRSRAASVRIVDGPWWAGVATIGSYHAMRGELDPAPLADAARALGIRVYLPVLSAERLRFADAAAPGRVDNRYGIPEPVGGDLVDALDLDLVIVPAAAVDVRGNRLGMGGGYYDRTFAGIGDRPAHARPTLVAFVHDEQVLDAIEPAPWDVVMDAIVTPTRTIVVNTD